MNHYSFLPWLRKGLANQLTVNDSLDHPAEGEEVGTVNTFQLGLVANAVKADGPLGRFDKTIHLRGPGDVIGLSVNAIIKTQPRSGTSDFAPNQFPYLEFYEEDFPWRYTPFAATANRLRPWVTLVVLEAEEFEQEPTAEGDLLPSIRIPDANQPPFPSVDQLWAWAHVQLNDSLGVEGQAALDSDSHAQATNQLARVLSITPHRACSRILCPRRLKANTNYTAFLIPTFEQGRLAGLGRTQAEVEAVSLQAPAWGNGQSVFPSYYSWNFRTGEAGDFESLVNKIEPRELDPRVGKHWVDIQNPGFAIRHEAREEGTVTWQRSTGADQLEQGEVDLFRAGAIQMEGPLRLPGSRLPHYLDVVAADQDTTFLDKLEALLNLQEDLQEDTSLQTDHPFNLNPYFGNTPTEPAVEISDDPLVLPPIYGRWHALRKRVDRLDKAHWLNQLNLDPRHRIAAGLGTEVVRQHQEEYMDAAWEQYEAIREYQTYQRELGFAQAVNEAVYDKHFRIGRATAEKILSLSGGLQATVSVNMGSGERSVSSERMSLGRLLHQSAMPTALLNLQTEKVVNPNRMLARRGGRTRISMPTMMMANPMQLLNVTLQVYSQSTWSYLVGKIRENISGLGATYLPTDGLRLSGVLDAKKFLQAWGSLDQSGALLPRSGGQSLLPFSTTDAANAIRTQIKPATAFAKKRASDWQVEQRTEEDAGVTAGTNPILAPDLVFSLYEPLRNISSENLLANLDLIPANTYALLETNRAFIESFLVGANHEMARELLWRHFPTDQRGTYFRHFWSNRDVDLDSALARDITPIHHWQESLGQHGPADRNESRMVILIKADLLRRFPNVITYLLPSNRNRRSWNKRSLPIFPSFFAQLEPDIYCVGFDMTVAEAQAGNGYFFIMQERPGELNFGLDKSPDPLRDPESPPSWDQLHWEALPQVDSYLDFHRDLPEPLAREGLHWGFGPEGQVDDPRSGSGHAAQMAAILLQKPVLIGVHLDTILPDNTTT